MSTEHPVGFLRGLGGRFVLVGAVGVASALVVGGAAALGAATVSTSLTELVELGDVQSTVQDVRVYNSDVTGWQVAYAADARKVGGAAAVDPESLNRAGYLVSAQGLRDTLDQAPVDAMSPAELALFEQIGGFNRWSQRALRTSLMVSCSPASCGDDRSGCPGCGPAPRG